MRPRYSPEAWRCGPWVLSGRAQALGRLRFDWAFPDHPPEAPAGPAHPWRAAMEREAIREAVRSLRFHEER